jgi:transposase
MTHAELLAEVELKSANWPEEARFILRLLLRLKDPTELQKELDELKMRYAALEKRYEDDKRRYEARIKELEDQLSKNSRNSSKPPSQDPHRPSNPRTFFPNKTLKSGGQKGHTGQGGKLKDDPDKIVKYGLEKCSCGHCLKEVEVEEVVRKQVVDIPPIKACVTEYQMEVKTCPNCLKRQRACGEDEPRHEFEYGPGVKSLAVYFSTHHFIPQKRIKEILSVWGIQLSTGTLNNFRKAASKAVAPFIAALREDLIASPALHFDETGMKVGGKNHWVHVASHAARSLFTIHTSRGRKAHESIGILPFYKGMAHHDSFRPYDHYHECQHSLCCTHFVRELIFAIDRSLQRKWAKPMIHLLLHIKKKVEARADSKIDPRWQGRFRKKYRDLLALAEHMNPAQKRQDDPNRNASKQSKTFNLIARLKERENDVLRFMSDHRAAFTNNQAERDLRMNKVRAKISGGFRGFQPAVEFMNIRSIVATAIKQAACPLETLVQVFTPGNQEFMRLAASQK